MKRTLTQRAPAMRPVLGVVAGRLATVAFERLTRPRPRFTMGPMKLGKKPATLGPLTFAVDPAAPRRITFGAKPPSTHRRKSVLMLVLGALAAYLLDPSMGRTRRAMVASRTGGLLRRIGREASRSGRRFGATARGLTEKAKHSNEEPKDFNDPTLQQKIQSEVLRADSIGINVDVAAGRVTLRGTVQDASEIRSIERAVRKTEGVRDVINLLHLPDTPAPNVEASLRAT